MKLILAILKFCVYATQDIYLILCGAFVKIRINVNYHKLISIIAFLLFFVFFEKKNNNDVSLLIFKRCFKLNYKTLL